VQDYAVDSTFIISLWRSRKITDEGAKRDLIISRCRNGLRLCQDIESTVVKERGMAQRYFMNQYKATLSAQMCGFRENRAIDMWIKQYTEDNRGNLMRYITLLFRGGSQQGKTQKAKSLFGDAHTLLVNCQGLGSFLPNLTKLNDPDEKFKCITYDEIVPKQVLENKQVFQAGNELVALGQSNCNQHKYEIWPYGIAMVCCSNNFPMTVGEGLDSEEDAEWLQSNVAVVELEDANTWYIASHTKKKAVYHIRYVPKPKVAPEACAGA